MLATNPVVRILENFATQALGILDVVIHCRVLGIDISRNDFGKEKSAPGHCCFASTKKDESSATIVPLQALSVPGAYY
jgi:hypothetical protein